MRLLFFPFAFSDAYVWPRNSWSLRLGGGIKGFMHEMRHSMDQ